MMASGVSTALPHLRAINPQVATILSAAAAKGGPRPLLPRQGGPRAVLGVPEAFNMGISSFAFQVGFASEAKAFLGHCHLSQRELM
jgi:hypothetical protein